MTQDFESTHNPNLEHQLLPGITLVNRYLIQFTLGVGGMGAVYRARDLHFPNVEKRVAVKEMINQARDPAVRDTIVRNFEREADLLATLNHSAIPRIYDYFTQNERSYLIEEYVDGKDLEAILMDQTGFFPEKQVVGWAIELCDVLDYLHNHKPDPVIFRDIKPSNIMINQHQHVVLVDFGIAKPFQSGQRGTMIGTEGYSPPEQYRGEATQLADIYALGATLHHLLTRKDPQLEAPFSFSERPIRQINANVSPELETVINKAISYNPEDRYQSAIEMKEALLNIARGSGSLPNAFKPGLINHPMVEAANVLWSFECEDEIRGTPTTNAEAVYVGSYDNNIYALNAMTGEFLWKYPTEGGIVSKPLVHEGNVYVGSEDKHLHVVSARSGKLNWLYYSDGPIRSSPRLAEGHIFFGSDDGYLHAVNAITGRRAWRAEAGAPVRSTPLVQNDLIYFGCESAEFYCLDLSGAVRWRFRAKRGITGSAAYAEGLVFIGSMDWMLYALDANTGWATWRYRLNKSTISTPCIAENLIFTGAADGSIYCLDIRTTKEIWRYSTDHQVTGSPVVYKDSLYCGSVDGNLYCLDYRTGRLRWKFNTNGPITGTPAFGDDTVYIGSTDHNLYALEA
ncbi:MAG: PQQ-binding-like beta-propeller repeat protein [Omnitrophica WOR_2 bacterium]